MTRTALLTGCIAVALTVTSCASTPDWARYEDGSPIRADEELEASLVLDSFNSDPALIALIQMHRGHSECVACTLERSLDVELVSLRAASQSILAFRRCSCSALKTRGNLGSAHLL